MKAKKPLILYVIKLLESETDRSHYLTQTEIADAISSTGVLHCDRKTVGRNIKALMQMGYPIVKASRGYYLDRKAFELEEVEFIRRAIMASEEKTNDEKEDIIDRLSFAFRKITRW